MARRGRHARRHAAAHGHAAAPVVDFEALKRARRARVPAAELAALLGAAAEACRSDPCGRYQHLLYVLSLLRAESRLVERAAASATGRSAAVDLAASGSTALALRALAEHGCGDGPERARLAAAGAATLAHLVAASGDNKQAVLEAGGVATLVTCLAHPAVAALEAGDSAAETELCVQCLRLLGNLSYGWSETVDAVKVAVGAAGAAAVVHLLAARGGAGQPLGQVLRWGAHALRNLAVTSPQMQTHCGDAGAIEVLCAHAARHQHALMAQLHACKAVAYLAKQHPANQARAASAGCMEMALGMLALVEQTESAGVDSRVAEAAEAGCSVIAFVVPGDPGRGAQMVEAGVVDALAGLLQRVAATDSGWAEGTKEAGQHREVAVRWSAVALAAVAQSVLDGGDAVRHSRLEQALRRCTARSVLRQLHEEGGWKKKTQEVMTLCLTAFKRSSALTSDQIQPEPEPEPEPEPAWVYRCVV